MRPWTWAAIAGLGIAAGAVLAPSVYGQARERQSRVIEPFEFFGRGAQIGVSVHDADDESRKSGGGAVIVDDVQADSPAAKAGIKVGDALAEFDGERVRSVRQFTRLVQETPVGRTVQAVLARNGQRVTVSVTPERASNVVLGGNFDMLRRSLPAVPAVPPAPATPRPPSLPGFEFGFRYGGGRLGISVEDLTDQLSEYFGVKEGVLVRSVTEGSVAAKAGLKAGDVITGVNGTHVNDPSDVNRAIERLSDGADITLDIVRDRKAQTLKGKLEPRQDRVRTRVIV